MATKTGSTEPDDEHERLDESRRTLSKREPGVLDRRIIDSLIKRLRLRDGLVIIFTAMGIWGLTTTEWFNPNIVNAHDDAHRQIRELLQNHSHDYARERHSHGYAEDDHSHDYAEDGHSHHCDVDGDYATCY